MAMTSKKAFANVNASQTDASIVAAVAYKSIRVVSCFMVTGATATDVTFNSKGSGSGTAITSLIADGANGGAVLNYNFDGWFQTSPGEALTVTTGAGSATGINVSYITI